MSKIVPHFTAARRAGDFIFVSGQMAFDESGNIIAGDVCAQMRQCLENIRTALASVNAGLDDVVKNMVWLTNTEDFPAFNTEYTEHFPTSPPARATVCSALMVPNALIEIESVAYKPLNKQQG